MAVAKHQLLKSYKARNDVAGYNDALAEFNKAADPRILQLSDMAPEEKARMKAAMTPAERKEFGDKIRRLHELGIIHE